MTSRTLPLEQLQLENGKWGSFLKLQNGVLTFSPKTKKWKCSLFPNTGNRCSRMTIVFGSHFSLLNVKREIKKSRIVSS
jgi:hypothetical protein